MLDDVKTALRIMTNDFDGEIQNIIDDCLDELEMLGLCDGSFEDDPQILSAVIYYCKARFGDPDNGDRWEKIYRDKVEKLSFSCLYGNR